MRMRGRTSRRHGVRGRAVTAAVLAALLAVSSVVLVPSAAAAVVANFVHTGGNHQGTPVLETTSDHTLKLQYGAEPGGSSFVIVVPAGVTVPDAALVVPAGNTAIASLVRQPGGDILVTFADPFPADVNQGALDLKFRMDAVQQSERRDLVWTVAGQEVSTEVIVRAPGDSFAGVGNNNAAKTAGWADLDRFVSVVDGAVRIDPAVVGTELPYSLSYETTQARTGFVVTDTLGTGLTLVPNSGAATVISWDAAGLNRTVTSVAAPTTAGSVLTWTGDLPAPSRLEITYRATMDAAALADLESRLTEQYRAIDPDAGGSYRATLANRANFGGLVDRRADRSLGGAVAAAPRPDLGQAFGKSVDRTERNVTPAVDGTLDPAVPQTYTLTADLTAWNGTSAHHTLTRDVVVTDTLPAQSAWAVDDPEFLTLTAGGAAVPLTRVDDAAAVAALVGSWTVVGQQLVVNVGRDARRHVVVAKAVTGTVQGLPTGWTDQPGATAHQLRNDAAFDWASSAQPTPAPVARSVTTVLLDRGDTSEGVDDPRRFSKVGQASEVAVTPGRQSHVSFTFTVEQGTTDFGSATVIDDIDHSIFDLSDLSKILVTSSSYDFQPNVLNHNSFDFSLDDRGRLVVAPSARFTERWPDWMSTARPWDRRMQFSLALPLREMQGKQTLQITNRATLSGIDQEETYRSVATAAATSFGSELEIDKSVHDAALGTWTKSLRVPLADDGSPERSEFVYRVLLLPHRGYADVRILPVTDVLPAGVEFVGFVRPENAAAGTVEPGTSYPIPAGRLTATWDAASRSVVIGQDPNTLLPRVSQLEVAFKVRLTDATPEVGITNRITGTSATITPTDSYPLNVTKWDTANPALLITDRTARFALTDVATGELVRDDIYVVDGALVVSDGAGGDRALTVEGPGDYVVREVRAPAGYLAVDDEFPVTVEASGSSDEVRIYNTLDPDPAPGRVSVGDHVWFDVNGDGLQDDGDVPLAGVVLTVLGPDGEPVALDADGAPYVATTTTDATGFYSFTGLPVLEPGQTYTVRVTAPEGYLPTVAGPGNGGGATDSSTGQAVSQLDLTVDGAHDPTLDFGFVRKSYAIGDVTWIDENRDGVQGDDEPVLTGVRVILLDADGVPVPGVAPQLTDEAGRYLFDELPAGSYRVQFELTAAQAAIFSFTATVTGGDAAADSDADPGSGRTGLIVLDDSTTALGTTHDRPVRATMGIDPTWDAGVIRRAVSVGDLVWVDENADGVQGPGEPGIPGVALVLTGPDRGAVTDVDGKQVGPATTDGSGFYEFTRLPSLPAGESYTVRIDREHPSTVAALAPYRPTAAQAGGDPSLDSSTWEAVSHDLTADGDRDPTLDFGFVPIPVEPSTPPTTQEPTTPTTTDEPTTGEPTTGEPSTPPTTDGPTPEVNATGTPDPATQTEVEVAPTQITATTTDPAPSTTGVVVDGTSGRARPGSAGSSPLADTGSHAAALLPVAVLLTLLGGLVLAATTRRRTG